MFTPHNWNPRRTYIYSYLENVTKKCTQRGHLTILGVYAPTEGRDELNKEFYETLQKILDKVNKNDYIMLIGDMNARVGNNSC